MDHPFRATLFFFLIFFPLGLLRGGPAQQKGEPSLLSYRRNVDFESGPEKLREAVRQCQSKINGLKQQEKRIASQHKEAYLKDIEALDHFIQKDQKKLETLASTKSSNRLEGEIRVFAHNCQKFVNGVQTNIPKYMSFPQKIQEKIKKAPTTAKKYMRQIQEKTSNLRHKLPSPF